MTNVLSAQAVLIKAVFELEHFHFYYNRKSSVISTPSAALRAGSGRDLAVLFVQK
jgi:hypothetical protein